VQQISTTTAWKCKQPGRSFTETTSNLLRKPPKSSISRRLVGTLPCIWIQETRVAPMSMTMAHQFLTETAARCAGPEK
jgi:hypothetical protein